MVEDDQVASTTYQHRLEREGFHVETASDGLIAVKTLSKLTVDLVILDLILPKLEGANVLKFMRANPHLQNVPVIVLSNAPSSELSEDALLTGPTRRLHKTDCPFPLLMETIQELFAITATQAARAGSAAGAEAVPASGNGHPNPNGGTTGANGEFSERGDFLKAALQKVPEIREHCCAYIRAPGSPATIPHLVELCQRANWVRTNAEHLNYSGIAMFARAFESLLSEIRAKPAVVTPSILQTIAQAVDCLALLLKSDEADLGQPMGRARVLVVDDDAVCCLACVNSLKRANFDVESINDPVVALEKLQTKPVDAFLLDINMPGITGFELCEKLRRLPGHKNVPVIFITGYSNFDNRKQSVLSGGQDFITKPIFPLELALKTTLHILKAQVQHPVVRNVPPEPGAIGTRNAGVPEIAKPESASLATGDRFAKNEPATVSTGTLKRIEIKAESPVPGPTATAVDAPSARADRSPPKLPKSTTPKPVLAGPQGTLTQAKSGQAATSAPSAPPSSGDGKPARSNQAGTESVGMPDAERAQLQAKLAAEQQAAARLRQDVAGLQRKLHENTAALAKVEKAFADLQRQTAGLTENAAAIRQAQSALREKENLCSRLEQELAGLRTERDELRTKLVATEKAAAGVQNDFEALRKQAHYDATLLAKTRADLQEQATRLSAAEKARKALQETEAQCATLEQTIADLKTAQTELQARLAGEQQAAAQLREQSGMMQQQSQESSAALNQTRADLQQSSDKLQALTTEAEQARKRLQEAEARCGQLEQDLAGAVAGRSELEVKLADEQQASAQLRQELETLQKQHLDSITALDEARADLKQSAEKLSALTAEAGQTGKQQQEIETRCRQLEQDLAAAVAGRSELERKLADEQQASAGLLQDFAALQQQHRESLAALQKARAELQQPSEELGALTAEAEQSRKRLQETEARCGQLEHDLAAAVAGRAELDAKLTDQLEAFAELRQKFVILQEQYQDSFTALNQARADCQQQSAERARLESELKCQQESATASSSQMQAALKEQEARCGQSTRELAGLQQENRELQARLVAEVAAAAKSWQDSAALQPQLSGATAALEQARAELQQRMAEIARLESEHLSLKAANENLNQELTRLREQVASLSSAPAPDAPTEVGAQTFRLAAPEAATVQLVGDFTGWQHDPVPMHPGVDGVWSATVKLLPGTYHYRFIVDGQWCEDPDCLQRVPNEFGGQNMVRQVV